MNDKQIVEELFHDHPEPDGYWYPNMAVVELQREAYKVGQSSQQGWIDVNERVPEEGVYVLAITKYRRIIEQSWESFTCQNKEWFEINFTHWMPLPNPPTPRK